MTFRLEGPVLEGTLVRLEPLTHGHAADLAVAAEQDRSSYGFTWVPRATEVDDYIHAQLRRAANGRMAPYAQVRISSGRAVGATAYWDPRLWPGEVSCAPSRSASAGWLDRYRALESIRRPSCCCFGTRSNGGGLYESI
jgi:hypothetical protein